MGGRWMGMAEGCREQGAYAAIKQADNKPQACWHQRVCAFQNCIQSYRPSIASMQLLAWLSARLNPAANACGWLY